MWWGKKAQTETGIKKLKGESATPLFSLINQFTSDSRCYSQKLCLVALLPGTLSETDFIIQYIKFSRELYFHLKCDVLLNSQSVAG